jgi:hypothetical protein
MNKKLIVCGCSFSAPASKEYEHLKGTAYGEVLAKKLDWDVEILARQGCSNGGIRIQIDEVLRQRPAFAIIAPTFHDRMEIPASAAPYVPPAEENKGWNSDLQKHLQKSHLNGYNRDVGINNVNYCDNPYTMICETIFSLAENYPHPYRSTKIDKATQQAVKQYVNSLYDSGWKLQMDQWIIREGILQLHYAGIPFLLIANNIWTNDTVRKEFPDVIPDHCLTLRYEDTPAYATNTWPFTSKEDPGYHGDPKSQTYLADRYYELITKVWNIT